MGTHRPAPRLGAAQHLAAALEHHQDPRLVRLARAKMELVLSRVPWSGWGRARAAGQLAQGAASRSLRPLGAYRIPYADRREEG
jgi:hypothetical protein